MIRPFLASLLFGLAVSGCSLVPSDCLYDRVGCDLPGTWRLVERNGTPVSGEQWEIQEGFVDRSGYGVMTTGNEMYPTMRGPFGSTYSIDQDDAQGFDLVLWNMPVEAGNVYVDLDGKVISLSGDRMVYEVESVRAKLIYNGGGSTGLAVPRLAAGTRFLFER